MRFSIFLSIISVFSFGLQTYASPIVDPDTAGLDKRVSTADVKSVLTTLQGKTNSILPQITALVNSNSVTEEAVAPLINQLVSAINDATSSAKGLPAKRGLVDRQSGDELADLVAGIVEDVVKVLDTLVGDLATIPLLAPLLAGVDPALANLLSELELLVAGLLTLVATLLVNVAGLLSALSYDLTLAALGL